MNLTKAIVEQVVNEMLELWQTEDNWVKGFLAQDRSGIDVAPDDENAISWCLAGCKARALTNLRLSGLNDFFDRFMANAFSPGSLPTAYVQFNDEESTTFEDVRLFVKCLKDKDVPVEPPCDCSSCVYARKELY